MEKQSSKKLEPHTLEDTEVIDCLKIRNNANNFYGGKTKESLENWKKLTFDKEILDIIGNGVKMPTNIQEISRKELCQLTT